MRFPVRADTEVTEDDLRGRTVVLYGNPSSNRVLARVADRLPVRFERGAIVVGSQRWTGPGVGAVFVAPSPFDSGHYVLVKAGTTWPGGRLMDRRPFLGGGFFGDDWRPVDPVSTP